jgi:hypothetical protein
VWEVDDQIRKKFKPPDVVSTFVWVVSLFEMFTWLWRLAKGVAELLSKLLLCCWPTDVAVLTSGIGGGNSTSTSSSSFVPVREGNWRQTKSITATTTATTTTTPCAVKLLSSQHNTTQTWSWFHGERRPHDGLGGITGSCSRSWTRSACRDEFDALFIAHLSDCPGRQLRMKSQQKTHTHKNNFVFLLFLKKFNYSFW